MVNPEKGGPSSCPKCEKVHSGNCSDIESSEKRESNVSIREIIDKARGLLDSVGSWL